MPDRRRWRLIRKAFVTDVSEIHRLLNELSAKGPILPQSRSEIYQRLRDYWLYHDKKSDRILGICSVHVLWEDAAEIRFLVLKKDARERAIDEELVQTCLKDAKSLGVHNVYILTNIPSYFKKFRFVQIDKRKLPAKIWADCLKCHRFPDCDEVAMHLDVNNF